jgi:CubicO group peptidase (beta-lactamase class C family)
MSSRRSVLGRQASPSDGLRRDLDAFATRGTKAFDGPGLAIGIVAGGKLVYAKGFGVLDALITADASP